MLTQPEFQIHLGNLDENCIGYVHLQIISAFHKDIK